MRSKSLRAAESETLQGFGRGALTRPLLSCGVFVFGMKRVLPQMRRSNRILWATSQKGEGVQLSTQWVGTRDTVGRGGASERCGYGVTPNRFRRMRDSCEHL